jgi:hypothetical protein
MTRFLALYDGKTVSSAELLAVSADRRLVEDFGRRLVQDDEPEFGPSAGPVDEYRPTKNGTVAPRRRRSTNGE